MEREGVVISAPQRVTAGEVIITRPPRFFRERHIGFFIHHLDQGLHRAYVSMSVHRVTLLFFCVAGLDALNALQMIDDRREKIIEWIYECQVVAPGESMDRCASGNGGFIGGPHLAKLNADQEPHEFVGAHLTDTYLALATLRILGDDFARVNKEAIVLSMKQLQLPSGAFSSVKDMGETDVRMVFSACAICTMLGDWSGMDRGKVVQFLQSCYQYDHVFSHVQDGEGHGGSSFCVMASLFLLGKLSDPKSLPWLDREQLIGWFVRKQLRGFVGRPNKLQDTCYSFWIGSSLRFLDALRFISRKDLVKFILQQQDLRRGGIAKQVGAPPDLMHSYLSIVALSMLGLPGFKKMYPPLNVTSEVASTFSGLIELPGEDLTICHWDEM